MGSVRGLALFGFALSTTAPLVLASLHEPLSVTLPTIALTLPMTFLIYSYVKAHWGPEGLYHYANSVSVRLGSIQLYSWVLSYLLYIAYTVVYINYMVLNLPDPVADALTIVMPITLSILVLTGASYLALLVLAIAQVALSLPIPSLGWVYQPALIGPITPTLFTGILSSSLLLVCITLIPYANGDPRDSRYVLYVFALSSILMALGSLFRGLNLANQLTSLGYLGLTLAEYTALYNLLHLGLKLRLSRVILPVVIVALDVVSLVNYSEFYYVTIAPSVAALYLTLLTALSIAPIYLRRVGANRSLIPAYIIASAVSSGLVVYGEYTVISASRGIYLYEVVAALVIPVILGFIRPVRVRT